MQEVDAVQIHVLCVPGKGAFPHAKIQVRSVDPLDFDPTLVLDSVQNGVKMADIPLSYVLQRRNNSQYWLFTGPLKHQNVIRSSQQSDLMLTCSESRKTLS